MYTLKSLSPLTDEQLFHAAPSVFASHASPEVSDKYRRVGTIGVVNSMRNLGWMPVRARQMKVRKADRTEFCKHEIRFQRMGDTTLSAVGDESIQALLTNSHDCTSSFCFMLGVYRLACSNGMVVSQGAFNSIRVRHVGFDMSEIMNATHKMAEGGRAVMDKIAAMKGLQLCYDEQSKLARDAALIVGGDAINTDAISWNTDNLFGYRRPEDDGNDLWHTFNRIQERITKGGSRFFKRVNDDSYVSLRDGTTRLNERWGVRHTRAINSIDRDIRVNQQLWALAEGVLAKRVG